MDLFVILSSLEKNEDTHLGRLLLLIQVFSGTNNSEVEGLTKLAKLDFLLRYPVYLERALVIIEKKIGKSAPKEYEQISVETKMVRYKYGPWDFRYRRFINTLVGMGLVYMRKEGRAYYLGITIEGAKVANRLSEDEVMKDIVDRAKLIRANFNISGTNLMRFIYRSFPEIGSLQYGTEIV